MRRLEERGYRTTDSDARDSSRARPPEYLLEAGRRPLWWNPHAAIVSKRFRHQGQLRLMVSTYWDTGWVDLGVTWVSKASAALVRSVGSRDIAPHRIRRG